MANDLVQLAISDGVATLTLNDPAHLNPLGMPLLQAALQALAQVQQDSHVRALVLRGAGRGFCVGADLGTFAAEPSPAARAETVHALLEQGGNPLVLALNRLPMPVLCAVHGPVAGGGVGLALAADVVIAAKSAFFYLPFVPALGLLPDMGAAWFLQRVLGPARTKALVLMGDRLSATQAADWGLIWRCVDDDALADETARLAQRLAALPAHAAPEVRALLRAADGNELPAQLAFESQRQRELMAGAAFDEGLQAFLARRVPSFPGR